MAVSAARADALILVIRGLSQMHQLSNDLEEFRRRMATSTHNDDNRIPLEAHLESLQKGILRLGDFRKRGAER